MGVANTNTVSVKVTHGKVERIFLTTLKKFQDDLKIEKFMNKAKGLQNNWLQKFDKTKLILPSGCILQKLVPGLLRQSLLG